MAVSIFAPLKAMLRSALSRGHGSTIWVASLVATELPPPRRMVSRRSRYSEQPASAVSEAASASVRSVLMDGRIGYSPWKIEHMPGERTVAGGGELGRDGRECESLLPRDLGLAEEEEVRIVGRQRIVGGRADNVARPHRAHQMRRDDDGEVGMVLLIGLAGEQRSQHWDAAEPRQLLDQVLVVGLQQTADHEALTVAQFDRGRGAPYDQGGYRHAVRHRHRMRGVDLAHFGLDLQVDQALTQHGRREG